MTKSEFKRRVESLRKMSAKVQKGSIDLINELMDMGVDVCAPSEAPNAEDIATAIDCYINYGEYDTDSIWKEIKGVEEC